MASNWPLPESVIIARTFQERVSRPVEEFRTEAGDAITRRLSTAARSEVDFQVLCNDAQIDTLVQFYRDDAQFGAAEFLWTHLRTGAVVRARFREALEIVDVPTDRWRASVALILSPTRALVDSDGDTITTSDGTPIVA